ncbi:MAG: MotA/TolQ/ExbB proton channel family protein [Burkholderiaceae bacterium]|nr:MotA/TolQ/ExbB proton channel family protein [Burkholderiaceae bacterium]MDO9089650.1 MotA/TolQ/ExbB proton channel family protein [Burkholderiaceae bacterium]MDP1967914.1 MotA/TolQ/ExbB proton channel family protein [Burkholderiaceae bacterium]
MTTHQGDTKALRRRQTLAAAMLAWVMVAAPAPALAADAVPATPASALVSASAASLVAPPVLAASPSLGAASAIKAPEVALDNPYGLAALWRQGDPVARSTLVLLLLMSLASWYVLVRRLIEQARMGRQARAAHDNFWRADTVRQGADALQADSVFRYIAESALEALRKREGLIGQVDLDTWCAQSIERAVASVHSRSQEGLALLATVGSTAPFVGLFGTVWGIYNALVKIGASGQASIDRVAGPVGEALIMTAIGLVVAVPAVMGYNWLVRRNKLAMDEVRAFGSDLHTVLLAGGGKAQA